MPHFLWFLGSQMIEILFRQCKKKFELIINQISTRYYGLDLFFSSLLGYFNKDAHWLSTQYCQENYQWMRSLRVIWSGSRGFTMSKISSFTSWKETGSCPWIFICSCIAYKQERQLRISICKLSNPACQPYFIWPLNKCNAYQVSK